MDATKVTDAERKYYRVEAVAQLKEKERQMNLKSIDAYYADINSVEKVIEMIKQEFKKGKQSEYNISEDLVNNFGYSLLKKNQNQEALKIFKLNTELYPNGFNTFDSYGECLMALGQKKEALKAYKKSLALNPQNDNARKIIDENK